MSKVVMTEHESGITLDFPATRVRRIRAWRLFEAGVLLLVGAVLWYALCAILIWPEGIWFALVLFIVGIVLLVIASGQAWSAWEEEGGDNTVLQISVVDDLFIRTARDHQKQVWFRREICNVFIERTANEICLAIALDGGANAIILRGGFGEIDHLESIAAHLRAALRKGTPGSHESLSQAIQVIPDHGKETRISS